MYVSGELMFALFTVPCIPMGGLVPPDPLPWDRDPLPWKSHGQSHGGSPAGNVKVARLIPQIISSYRGFIRTLLIPGLDSNTYIKQGLDELRLATKIERNESFYLQRTLDKP
jgi:hypothetical protein